MNRKILVILVPLGALTILVLIGLTLFGLSNRLTDMAPVLPDNNISRERAVQIATQFATHPGFGPAYTGDTEPRLVEAKLMTYGEAMDLIGEGSQTHARDQVVWLIILAGSWGPQFVSGPATRPAPPSYTPLPSPASTPAAARYYRLVLDARNGDLIQALSGN